MYHSSMANESSEARKEPIDTEASKVVMDYLKHMTTLASGSIVILAALVEKLPHQSLWLVVISFISFALSIVMGLFAMRGQVAHAYYSGQMSAKTRSSGETRWTRLQASAAMWCLVIGLYSLVGFAVANMNYLMSTPEPPGFGL